MAVQKSRTPPRRRGNRRSHDKIKNPTVSIDQNTGEEHLRHHITSTGYYRGKPVISVSTEQ